MFVNKKILEEYPVKNYEIHPYFYEHYKKKHKQKNKLMKMGVNIYFLAVEIDEKGHTDRDLTFEEKR